ncbi:hypothetical protein ABEB36_004598 [Hypothenemus hampei]|uniref:DNA 3'-5' helicase n=1 Tax=Hypothenemus hampei TaxID=57062 RepID=A0ABD1F3Y9_HYPHA
MISNENDSVRQKNHDEEITESSSKKLKVEVEDVFASMNEKWSNENFQWSKELKVLLDKFFKFPFRPYQLTAINAILSNKHVLVVKPSGSGKSLIYQMVSIYTKKLTVVIAPMISLIEDQLINMNKRNIPAEALHSHIEDEVIDEVFDKMWNGNINILFITPEQFRARNEKRLRDTLKMLYDKNQLGLFVIDEVHCISKWKNGFRKAYQELSGLQKYKIPILGLTATMTPSNLTKIKEDLQLENPVVIKSPKTSRDNIVYKVIPRKSIFLKVQYITSLLKETYSGQSVIIYCSAWWECEYVYKMLIKNDIDSCLYHVKMSSRDRKKSHNDWLEEKFHVMVTTNAFGMGINKSDVCLVIHYSVPRSLEHFVQESGRARRDGQRAQSIILYSLENWLKVYIYVKDDKNDMIGILKYCLAHPNCRRKVIDDYFNNPCHDNCEKKIKKILGDKSSSSFLKTYLLKIGKNIKLIKKRRPYCTLNDLISSISFCSIHENVEDIIAYLLITDVLKVEVEQDFKYNLSINYDNYYEMIGKLSLLGVTPPIALKS